MIQSSLKPPAEQGRVLALFVQTKRGAAPQAMDHVTATIDHGFKEDLHGRKPGSSRQVLLVEQGDLAALGLRPGDLREQVTLNLPGLMSLPEGTRLELGDATVEITKPCEPCTHIGSLLGASNPEGFRQHLEGRRGMLTRVVAVREEGRVSLGDVVIVRQPVLA